MCVGELIKKSVKTCEIIIAIGGAVKAVREATIANPNPQRPIWRGREIRSAGGH